MSISRGTGLSAGENWWHVLSIRRDAQHAVLGVFSSRNGHPEYRTNSTPHAKSAFDLETLEVPQSARTAPEALNTFLLAQTEAMSRTGRRLRLNELAAHK
jgi:hypothetical protein